MGAGGHMGRVAGGSRRLRRRSSMCCIRCRIRRDVIFAGQVMCGAPAGERCSFGVVEVEFRVDQAIRGCTRVAHPTSCESGRGCGPGGRSALPRWAASADAAACAERCGDELPGRRDWMGRFRFVRAGRRRRSADTAAATLRRSAVARDEAAAGRCRIAASRRWQRSRPVRQCPFACDGRT